MKENKLADLSMLFAVNALDLANSIESHYSLKNQFERSATSIGETYGKLITLKVKRIFFQNFKLL